MNKIILSIVRGVRIPQVCTSVILAVLLALPIGMRGAWNEPTVLHAQEEISQTITKEPGQIRLPALATEHKPVLDVQPAANQTYEPSAPTFQNQQLSAVSPLLQAATCPKGSILTIVPHQDDDTLFTSPDLLDEIKAGRCITTVYLTAGDAGSSSSYWTGREQGAEAAYSLMLNSSEPWQQKPTLLNGHEITISQMSNVPQITLIFFRLPDGNLGGQGFASTQYASLYKLRENSIETLQSVDGHTSYTEQELVQALRTLMEMYQPDQIRTLDYSEDLSDGDHSDHHAAGYFTKQAFQGYFGVSSLRTYMGYPGDQLPENIPIEALENKEAAFYAYATHDPAVCSSNIECISSPYHSFLSHQYSKLYPR